MFYKIIYSNYPTFHYFQQNPKFEMKLKFYKIIYFNLILHYRQKIPELN